MTIVFDPAIDFLVDFGIPAVEDPTSDDPRVNLRLAMVRGVKLGVVAR